MVKSAYTYALVLALKTHSGHLLNYFQKWSFKWDYVRAPPLEEGFLPQMGSPSAPGLGMFPLSP